MKVEHITNRKPKICRPQDWRNQAAEIMWENTCGGVPVLDEGDTDQSGSHRSRYLYGWLHSGQAVGRDAR